MMSTESLQPTPLLARHRSPEAIETDRPTVAVGSLRVDGVFLAPLSGITDVPFRKLARRFGAGLVFSEMVASGELVGDTSESLRRAMSDGQGIHAVQLAGREPQMMERAAARLRGSGVDLIDINMGCPAKKVVGGLSGSALMREPDLALRMVEATVAGAGAVPVTLKMRLGWDASTINAPQIARRAEAAGVRMITVHGRTRMQFYEGRADWKAIAAVKDAVSIPVVANGDLTDAADEPRMRAESRCDAVMVGRGACGRPWFPGLLSGRLKPHMLRTVGFGEIVAGHYDAMLSHYGARMGVRHARKHLGWYLDAFARAVGARLDADRVAMLGEEEPASVLRHMARLFGAITAEDIEFGRTAPSHARAA